MDKTFDLYLNIAPLLKDILQQDISITITDTSTVLYYSPGETLDHHSKVMRRVVGKHFKMVR